MSPFLCIGITMAVLNSLGIQQTQKKIKKSMQTIFGACLYSSLLILSDPGDFLDFNVFMVVSNSSIVIKSTQFSVNFAHFSSVVLSLNCLVQSL